MTLTDELKILDDKIKANEAQYELGIEAAEISDLSSKDLLEKYKHLSDEDLGHRPSVLEKTKFEYSPLGHLVNHLKKIMSKILRIKRLILIIMVSINFTDFTSSMMNLKRCHELLSTIR